MKTIKRMSLIAFMLFNITLSYASSATGDDPENPLTNLPGETTEPEFYNCIHQESKLGKHGRIYLQAYKYAIVMEGEYCPPFSNVYEHPLNEVTTEDIVWGGLAEPELPEQAHCDIADPEPEVCEVEIHANGITSLSCNLPLSCQYSELDHTCRWGLGGGGNPF
ncbi:MAG: hypothetical protein JKX98_11190 [Alcanivoracaceae bacterium]|nr:hypothetical protein [Alcanivoracaceae bacterium]